MAQMNPTFFTPLKFCAEEQDWSFFFHLFIIFLMIYIQEEVKVVLDVGRMDKS